MSTEYVADSIPAGYKQTEVGVIPEDWSAKTWGDVIVNCFSGATPSRSRPDFFKGDIRWITSGELNYNIINDTYEKITQEAVEKTNLKILPKKTFLMAITGLEAEGTRGSCAIVGEESTTNQSCMAIFPNEKLKVQYLFHYYVFKGKELALQYCQGTKQQSYTAKIVKLLPITVPPLPEQESIATALSDTDALIESLEQLIAKKREIKQGAMQELLTGKRRLPGFSGEWIECSLQECLLANPDYGINAPGVPNCGNFPTYLRITDIDDDGRFMPDNQVAVNHPLARNYLLGRNEIVFARTGASVGKTYLYNIKDGELVFAGFLIRARINCEKLCPEFFAAFTKTSRYWNWVRMMSMRSGQPGINGNEFASLNLYLPPTLEEQTAIAIILSDMDTEITALEEKLAKTRQIKQGMMQELLTGRIRLV